LSPAAVSPAAATPRPAEASATDNDRHEGSVNEPPAPVAEQSIFVGAPEQKAPRTREKHSPAHAARLSAHPEQRDPSEASDDGADPADTAPADAPVCHHDPHCFRKNPEHLRAFRHPSRDAQPPKRAGFALDVGAVQQSSSVALSPRPETGASPRNDGSMSARGKGRRGLQAIGRKKR
jgi:hypothetical protein